MRAELLVDSAEVQARLEDDLRRARRRSWIQTFSFEGDRERSWPATSGPRPPPIGASWWTASRS